MSDRPSNQRRDTTVKSPTGPAPRRAAITLAAQWIKVLIQLSSLTYFAHVLDPSEFGKVAMIIAIAGIGTVIGDLGLSLAAMQAKELSVGLRDKLFWANVLLGGTFAVALTVAAHPISSFYDQDLDTGVFLLAPTFLINGAAAQYRADLARRNRTAVVAFIDVAGQALGFGTAVMVSIFMPTYVALVVQQLASTTIVLIGVAFAAGWLPLHADLGAKLDTLKGFGVATTLTQGLNFVSSNIDSLTLGKFATATVLGVYSRAYQLFAMPLQQLASPLTPVVLPRLARTAHDDGALAFQNELARVQVVICWVVMAAISLGAAFADLLVKILLGDGWSQVVPILRILLLGAAFQAAGYAYYWGFLATARMKALFISEVPGRLTMCTLIYMAAVTHKGAVGVAWAHTFGLFFIWLITSTWASKKILSSRQPMLKSALTPGCILGLACAVSIFSQSMTPVHHDLASALVGLAAFGAVVSISLAAPSVRKQVSQVTVFGTTVLRGRR